MELTIEEQKQWEEIVAFVQQNFQKSADVKSLLFLIGHRELGMANYDFEKEEKQDLMNLATCKILSYGDYFKISGYDEDQWPVWEQEKPLPRLEVAEQETFLVKHIIRYFVNEGIISHDIKT